VHAITVIGDIAARKIIVPNPSCRDRQIDADGAARTGRAAACG
jgi:hypothetical protein